MSQEKKILKNTLIYAIGNFGSKALSFILLPLYSFYLTKDEFGIYDLFIVTINLIAPIVTLQISDATYRWLIETNNKKEQTKIIFNGFFLISITSIFFYIIYFISTTYFIKIRYSNYFAFLLLISLFIPFFQKVLRGLGKNLNFAISGIINTFLILILNLLFLTSFNLKIESLFIASIISNTIVLIYILKKINTKDIFNFENVDLKELRLMIKYSLPLVPNSISWWLINASDKYLILYFLNIQSNGIYAISTRFPAIIMLLNSIFLMAWQDHALGEEKNKKNTIFFSKMFNKFITLEMTLVIFLVAISPYLVKYLINPDYIEAWKYLPLLFIGTAFNAFSAYIGVGFQHQKKTKGILITSLTGGIINFTIGILLIPKIGLYAPAIGTFISFLIVYLIRKHKTNSFFKINVNNIKLFLLTFISLVFALLVNINNLYIRIFLVFLSLILLFTLNKSVFLSFIKIIKQQFLKYK